MALSKTGITGMGIISSIGNDLAEFSAALQAGKSGIRKVPSVREPAVSVDIVADIQHFHFLGSLERLQDIPAEKLEQARRLGRRAPLTIQVSLIAALQAWHSARLFSDRPSPDRTGLIVAGQNSTQNYQYDIMPKFRKDPEYLSPRYALEFLETNQVGVLSELFDIKGEGFVVGGASATGNVGIIKGCQLIQLGLADVCLVMGVVADLSPMDIQGFVNIGAMGGKHYANEPEKACRPFDSAHEGFIYGQAGACVIIESAESARRRGVPLMATIMGSSLNLDANSSADPNINGETKAMLSALRQAGLSATDLGYINTHGSSSPLGDKTEAAAIGQVFGEHASRLWLNATKGLTGHCLYAAGLVEAIATVEQLRSGFLHGNKNLETPICTHLQFCGAAAVQHSTDIAMSNAFGFGGINTSIIFRREQDGEKL
ncbi:beta-ketoacyl-ACP synthase [Chitinophaga varians]|nr:beta-ketoacyl-ACP synthase [Chitinophaga varians]